VDRQEFYLLFIPGLTITAFAIGVAFSALAFIQGPYRSETRRGFISMTVVILIVVGLGILAFNLDHPALPK
jgi:hypothetical protein